MPAITGATPNAGITLATPPVGDFCFEVMVHSAKFSMLLAKPKGHRESIGRRPGGLERADRNPEEQPMAQLPH